MNLVLEMAMQLYESLDIELELQEELRVQFIQSVFSYQRNGVTFSPFRDYCSNILECEKQVLNFQYLNSLLMKDKIEYLIENFEQMENIEFVSSLSQQIQIFIDTLKLQKQNKGMLEFALCVCSHSNQILPLLGNVDSRFVQCNDKMDVVRLIQQYGQETVENVKNCHQQLLVKERR